MPLKTFKFLTFFALLIVNKSDNLSWTINISWSKNASLPIIASCLLIKWEVILKNIPSIGDIYTFLDILSELWVKNDFKNNTLKLDCSHIKNTSLDLENMKKLRASILLLAPLLIRLGKISIPTPGWCNLWKRPIDTHLNWLKDIWYDYKFDGDNVIVSGNLKEDNLEISASFGVTSTENLIVANVLRKGKTTIKLAAIEPHVVDLISFLRKAWARIFLRYDHTIIIDWVSELKSEFDFSVISDYIQSWTYMIIWALLSKEFITIENARLKDLYSFTLKLKEAWVKILPLWWDKVKVYRCNNLKATSIQTNVFPGFPTDLQSPFAILMTQSKGISKIHEVLFEARLWWLIELEKMWCKVDIINRHEVLISGKSNLYWASVTSWDLRAWASLVIAWLLASWESKITNVEYINRGYENLVKNLKSLWASIREVR